MKLVFSLLFIFLAPALTYSCDEHGKTGILPKNDAWIGADSKVRSEITEERFNAIIDEITDFYKPIFEEKGANLIVGKRWDDGTVNAYARRAGDDWHIVMFGGLARHVETTEDGFALVVCHELGHHIGGSPIKGSSWASNEGQSDYWATLKCFRNYVQNHDNDEIVAGLDVPEIVSNQCDSDFEDVDRRLICKRSAMGGLSLGRLLASFNGDEIAFDTPSDSVVTTTYNAHPKAQCRLDTYYQGSLCAISHDSDVDDEDATIGTCNRVENHESGLRPLCWFKPQE